MRLKGAGVAVADARFDARIEKHEQLRVLGQSPQDVGVAAFDDPARFGQRRPEFCQGLIEGSPRGRVCRLPCVGIEVDVDETMTRCELLCVGRLP